MHPLLRPSIICLAFLVGAAGARAAVLASASGTVTVTAGSARGPAKAGAPLPSGAKVETGPGAEALVLLADGTKVRVGPDSVFAFEGEGGRATDLRLAEGFLTAWVRKMRGRRLNIRTPAAVAAVRGTVTSAEHRRGRSRFALFTGSLWVTDRFGRSTEMTPGQASEIHFERGLAGTTPLPPGTRPPEEPPTPPGLETRPAGPEADEADEVEGPELEMEDRPGSSPEQETSIDEDDFPVSPSAP